MSKIDDLPKAISSGDFHFMGETFRVHVLDDGRRIIEEADMRRILELLDVSDINFEPQTSGKE
jgi:hypothetical protein